MKVRVRYAPSPTGHLHIGNARTALFNYLFAKKNNGDFVVRIEDTDVARNVSGGETSQLKFLNWLGIDWDESVDKDKGFGPYRQLERLDIYKKYADLLVEKGLAYKCYCTTEDLELEREQQKAEGLDKLHYSRKCLGLEEQDKPFVLRFKVPEDTSYTFNDIVKGEVTFQSSEIGDWVMVKNNGIPTYNFACAIDDHLMEISHVLRGEDHITNTPKQMMIYNALGWDIPTFAHMTLIVNQNNKKLSKRDESIIQFIEQYQELGYLPEALFNFISLLGWSPNTEDEILSKDQFIEYFDEKRLSKSPAKFDKEKLAYINNRYIKDLTVEETVELCMPFLIKENIIQGQSDEWVESLVSVFKDRLSFGAEIVDLYDEFVDQEFILDDEMTEFINQEGVNETLITFRDLLTDLDDFRASNLFPIIKQTGKDSGAKGKMLYMPLRIATTASMHGPDLPKILDLLGKEKIISRLNQVIK
ncbi:glutamate--tRNA ligase [Candidatus Izimaplasma bacterium ZiA1]|uniref:glutamate--tRNA ligase n=1 Tax=Candidatus Izimoplasma sp. ZiA1 TaxID=2024899 RepID=UPI000BAA600C|nr:glutamate--tRNA ligase [Candidatus Izimaplasma bacterium ZiA1]